MPEAPFGVLALYPTAQALLDAIPGIKARGFSSLEAYTPFPVHGMEAALGLKKSRLGTLVFIMAVLGAVSGFLFEWWTSAVDYPLVIGGKPFNSWQAFVPVMFEVTVLFATFTAGLAMLFLFNRLPFFGSPILGSKAIRGTTKDRFGLLIMPEAGVLDVEAASAALLETGGSEVEVLAAPDSTPPGLGWWLKTLSGITAACVVTGFGTAWAIKIYPTLPPMVHMEVQPRLDAQKADSFFADGHGMQLPPVGTVARGYMPLLAKSPEEAGKELINPLPVTPAVLQAGRDLFNNHCAVCHDRLGTGKPWLTSAYTAKPADLQASTYREAPDGYIYYVIAAGKGAMPSYAADLSANDRWAIVDYVRALQRSQHAEPEDVQ